MTTQDQTRTAFGTKRATFTESGTDDGQFDALDDFDINGAAPGAPAKGSVPRRGFFGRIWHAISRWFGGAERSGRKGPAAGS